MMRNTNHKISRFILLLWLTIMLQSSTVSAFASRMNTPEVDPDLSALPKPVVNKYDSIVSATELICQGEFDQAAEQAGAHFEGEPERLTLASSKLLEYISDYNNIKELGLSTKETSYSENLEKLDELRTSADINDINDVVEVLVTARNISELADSTQRQGLLNDEYVQQVERVAKERANEYESEGQWLESYSNCYYWLAGIDPNNKEYEEYAQSLYDRAVIEASFEDSPCETSEERYEGVTKQMFALALSHLELYYVNEIDYNDMIVKSLDRCRLLGDVLKYRVEDFNSLTESPDRVDDFESYMTAWSQGLDALGSKAAELTDEADIERLLLVFENVLRLNDATLDLPEAVVITHFSEAALETLDPYTVIVWPTQVQNFEKTMTNEFSGIGILISKPDNILTVSSLLPDTPAYNAGLDAGDVIEAVDGVSTVDMTLTCAVRKITGPKGSKVTLTIKRPGKEETEDVVIVRNTIVVSTIYGWQRTPDGQWHYMLDEENKIGYVRISSFSAETASDLEATLDELEAQGMRGLILDLRNNSGGLLDSAVDVCDKFLDSGLIVSRKPGFGRLPTFEFANRRGTHPDYPLVILVNEDSASASEIVAGALADQSHERATLVGTRTHGKGSVQGIININGGAELKYTIAYYHLPSDQRVESREAMEKLGRKDWGIGPDIDVELTSDELVKMREVQRDNDVLAAADHDNSVNEVKKHNLEETLNADRQLAVGLLAVKSKLVQEEALDVAMEYK